MKHFLKKYSVYFPILALLALALPCSVVVTHQQAANGHDRIIHQSITGFEIIGYGISSFSLHTLPFLLMVVVLIGQVVGGFLKKKKIVFYIAVLLFTIIIIPLVADLFRAIGSKSLAPFSTVQWGVPVFAGIQGLIALFSDVDQGKKRPLNNSQQ